MLAILEEGARRGVDQLVLNPFAAGPRESLAHLSPGVYAPRMVAGWPDIPRTRRWLADRLSEFHPHVVHAHLFHALVMLATTAHTRDARWVLSHQHGNHLALKGRRISSILDRLSGRRFDRVVAISGHVRRYLLETYGYPEDKVILIPNGWDGNPRPSGTDRERSTIVSVGNLRPEKGHETLLDAFSEVVSSVPDARLLLVGDGPLKGTLERQATELRISDRVEFVGATDDVWGYYARASVFALPSHHEMLGIAALEAMGAGLPVVASRVGGIPEIVAEGKTGFLVPPREPAALAARIVELLNSPERCVAMGEAGRVSVQELRMERTVDAYFDLYTSLVAT